jgi:hypothetical protein
MKAIVSHDIDHFTITEHLFKDLIVPKHMVRAHLEFMKGFISFSELLDRMREVFSNQWNYIPELIKFNKGLGIPTTFFLGVKNGLGLSYSLSQAQLCMEYLKVQKVDFGLHGIQFENESRIEQEFDLFRSVSGLKDFGMRMHYVRMNENTLSNFSKLGAKYDTTVSSFENPYKIGEMWEFPFQIMDGWIIENGKKQQSRSLIQCKEETLKILDQCEGLNLKYIGIDFHDRYFSKSHKTWMAWYIWLMEELKLRKIEFTSFEEAISELTLSSTNQLQQMNL